MLLAESQTAEREAMAEVPVNGKVLEWARTIRGLDLQDAAVRLAVSPDDLRAYESGTKKPLVGFLRLMSAQYQINFTSLLMPEPLPIEKRPTDHRVRRGERPLSIDTLVAMEQVNEALEAFQDIADATRRIVTRLNIGTAQLQDDPETVAARERKKFGVGVEEQRGWRGLDEARRQWRQRIEDRGVFSYMIPMPPNELSGFSILRDDVAAICVNDGEPTEGAKTFTLFHEYCHLLLRQAGISDENNTNSVERFCNEFAASFLIPRNPLLEAIGEVKTPHEFPDGDIRRLAARFKVSNSAIALRLEKTGLAPTGFYGRRTAPWDLPAKPKPVTLDRQHPSYIKIRIKRLGRLHATTVLRAFTQRTINSFDASELIGVQPTSLGKVKAALG
jgi:Zn-dependent peptidase ImmA (M78 family)